MSRTTDPHVVAVVLNWNNYDDTAECVESLQSLAYDGLDLLVVDNGSTDGSGEKLEAAYPDVTVLSTGENLGFSGGMNVGIRHALEERAAYVWIINNDSLYEDPNVLSHLVETMENEPDVGIISPKIHRHPETEQVWFERGNVDERSLNADHNNTRSVLDLRVARPGIEAYTTGALVENDYVPLCSALVRREVFDTIGLLPERHFLYYEDVAYCREAAEAGFRLVTLRDAVAYHKDGASTEGDATARYYTERNRMLYARENGEAGVAFVLLSAWRLWVLLVYNLVRRNLETVRALLAGAVHAIRNIDGRGPYP